jgi:hypothetical protein
MIRCPFDFISKIRGNTMYKILTGLAVAATIAGLAVVVPQQAEARGGGALAAGIIGGVAAGAIIGSVAANNGYYGPGYGYGYGPGPYAYAPAPVYVQPAPARYYRGGGCWIATDTSRGYGYYGPCN